jgi:hypothetical protein
MAYTITNSDGTTLASIEPGTSNSTTTSLTLVGKNFPGYGQFLNENFIQLLENFASGTAPQHPQEGQLWWDKNDAANKVLKVYMGSAVGWKRISGATSSATRPDSAYDTSATGDLWWDSANAQLKVNNGGVGDAGWTVIGPAFTATTGQSGAIADILSDGTATHVIVKFLINNKLAAILSTDPAFTPSPLLTSSGFNTINPGMNLADDTIGGTLVGLRYWGNANNADKLGGSSASVFARLSGTTPFSAAQTISSDSGLTVGAAGDVTVSVVSGAARISSAVTGHNLDFFANVSGTPTRLLTVGGDGTVKITANTALGSTTSVATKKYVDDSITGLGLGGSGGNTTFGANLVPTANLTYNLGSTTAWWNNIYGTSIHAQYADVAERFEADAVISPGTVVELGGAKEITAVVSELSENILGVISTKAAYLMNSGAGSDSTHPPVAVSGRVPVRVIGPIKKGDRLVSAGNGLARAGARTEISPWNVIGRALTSKTTAGEGIIEATVKLNS